MASGGTNTASEKARGRMVAAVWKAVLDVSIVLDHSEDVLLKAVKERRSRRVVAALYGPWIETKREMDDLINQFWNLATNEEQDEKDDELQRCTDRMDNTSGEVEAYLARGPDTKPTPGQLGALDAEKSRVKDEITQIEKQISSLSVISPAAPRPKVSASWETASRCGGNDSKHRPLTTKDAPAGARPSLGRDARSSTPQVQSKPVAPVAATDLSTQLLIDLTKAIASRRDSLPKMEPDIFSGDMLKFPMWMSSFEALIEKHTSMNSERLFFLGKYTTGEAHESIAGYLTLFADDAYLRAKQLLMNRYGDRLKVAQAYRDRLFGWKVIKKHDAQALQKYADFLWQCSAAMSSIGHLDSLSSAEENAKMVKILPQYIVDKGFRIVDRWYYRGDIADGGGMDHDDSVFPPFDEFCRLVSTEARIVNGPAYKLAGLASTESTPKAEVKSELKKSSRRAHNFASSAAQAGSESSTKKETKKKPVPACFLCKDAHYLNQCSDFMKLPQQERRDFAADNHLCFGCLGRGHGYSACRWKNPSLLGKDEETTAPRATVAMNTRVTRSSVYKKGSFFSMMVPVRVTSQSSPMRSTVVYALLDTQSDTTFVSEDLIEHLRLDSEAVKLRLVTMGDAQTVDSRRVAGLVVESAFGGSPMVIDECFSRVLIPADRAQMPDACVVEQFPHLRPMHDQLLPEGRVTPISILIGNDQPSVFVHEEQLYEDDDKPYGVKTRLGWSLMGRRETVEQEATTRCFSTSARVVNVGEIAKVFDLDFNDVHDGTKMSYEDQLFIQKAKESLRVQPDGRLEMDLPFREEPAIVPDNRDVAWKRLMSIKRKILANVEYGRMYGRFMDELVEQGYAEPAPDPFPVGMGQYMPHHAVAHPRKPGELRGVFDAAAEKSGVSLNKLLLPGPDMTNNLVGVLCNFRLERVAFMCDIRKMFMQVGVSPKHRDYLRYLWFENGDVHGNVVEYRMKVLSFGATSSPASASYALKELATMHAEDFDDEVVSFIQRQFYVDDGLGARETARKTVELFMRSHELCQRGGFWLHKFTSNSEEALRAVPQELLASSAREWLTRPDSPGVETSLGITWDRVRDAFVFIIREFCKQLTRRGLLSSLSGIYDPIGFVSPVVLVGRLLLQELCGQALPWDQPLPEEYATRWLAWYHELMNLKDLTIPRCVRANTEGEITSVEMHHFCDASSVGYGACSYLRLVDADDVVDVTLVFAKARVGPKRAVTIPRLELQSAVLATKLANFLDSEMNYQSITHWYWTDSMVSLGYITNPAKRFHLYVANRVQTIRDRSDVSHWNHVSGDDNPADLASRGVSATELVGSRLWWKGPGFLKQGTTESDAFQLPDDDPEIKLERRVTFGTISTMVWIEQIAEGCNSFHRLTYRVAVFSKYLEYLRTGSASIIVTADLQAAKVRIVRLVQEHSYPDELATLERARGYPEGRGEVRERNRRLRNGSGLQRLDVFLDDLGVIRVGGRLRRSYLPEQVKHPVVIPRRGRVTTLLLLHFHLRSHHAGRQQTLAGLRGGGFWVMHARAAVDELLRACVTCKRIKAAPMTQKMADLPDCRVRESPPFTFCGVDLFGPVTTKEGRSLKKRWICLVTCMASRAVHLEPVYSLSTESFLNALRRVISRRGPIRQIFSDQGTNFVGASHEFRKCMAEMNEDRIKQELLKSSCDWTDFRFNPPTASHMGGVWERMVKSAKTVFLQLLAQFGEWVSDEMLWTLIAEVEGTLNNRPITCVDVMDPWGEPPLTPARLLTQKYEGMSVPPGKFDDVETYGRKAWRRVQSIADRFWRQWRVEFLPDLQLRRKWNNRQFNIKKGDIVMMIDKDVKRNRWPIARVEEALPSADGLVRAVRLRVGQTSLERPIAKLIFLCDGQE